MESVIRNIPNKPPVFEPNKVGVGVKVGVVLMMPSECWDLKFLRYFVLCEVYLAKFSDPADSLLEIFRLSPAGQAAGEILDQLSAFAKVIFENRTEILYTLEPCVNLLDLLGA